VPRQEQGKELELLVPRQEQGKELELLVPRQEQGKELELLVPRQEQGKELELPVPWQDQGKELALLLLSLVLLILSLCLGLDKEQVLLLLVLWQEQGKELELPVLGQEQGKELELLLLLPVLWQDQSKELELPLPWQKAGQQLELLQDQHSLELEHGPWQAVGLPLHSHFQQLKQVGVAPGCFLTRTRSSPRAVEHRLGCHSRSCGDHPRGHLPEGGLPVEPSCRSIHCCRSSAEHLSEVLRRILPASPSLPATLRRLGCLEVLGSACPQIQP